MIPEVARKSRKAINSPPLSEKRVCILVDVVRCTRVEYPRVCSSKVGSWIPRCCRGLRRRKEPLIRRCLHL